MGQHIMGQLIVIIIVVIDLASHPVALSGTMERASDFIVIDLAVPGPRYGPLPALAREWADIAREQNALEQRRASERAELRGERLRLEYQLSRVFAELLGNFGRPGAHPPAPRARTVPRFFFFIMINMAASGADGDFSAVAAVLDSPLETASGVLAACDRILHLGEQLVLPKVVRARLLIAIRDQQTTATDHLLLERLWDTLGAVQHAATAAPRGAKPRAGGAPECAARLCDGDDTGLKLAIVYDSFARPPPRGLPDSAAEAPAPEAPVAQVEVRASVEAAAVAAAASPATGRAPLGAAVVAAAASPVTGITLVSLGDAPRGNLAPTSGISLLSLGGAPANAAASPANAAASPRKDSTQWQPGEDVRGFIGGGRYRGAILPQTQVVLMNAYLRLDRVPNKDKSRFRKLSGHWQTRARGQTSR
jgi:hypothetical protein